jgi:hypothetical protein
VGVEPGWKARPVIVRLKAVNGVIVCEAPSVPSALIV